jgi:negative regulator of flagellin synthesis FlgM
MKIGHPADKPATAAPATTAGHGAPAASAAAPIAAASAIPAQADASAKIQLSSTASTLRTGSATPEFDAEKVARISKAIDGGSFKINPEVIADKLISNAQELLSKTRS